MHFGAWLSAHLSCSEVLAMALLYTQKQPARPFPTFKGAEASNHVKRLSQPLEKHLKSSILDQVFKVFTYGEYRCPSMTPVWDIRLHLSLLRATLRPIGNNAPLCQHSHQPPTETTLRKEEPQELILAPGSDLMIMNAQPVLLLKKKLALLS